MVRRQPADSHQNGPEHRLVARDPMTIRDSWQEAAMDLMLGDEPVPPMALRRCRRGRRCHRGRPAGFGVKAGGSLAGNESRPALAPKSDSYRRMPSSASVVARLWT